MTSCWRRAYVNIKPYLSTAGIIFFIAAFIFGPIPWLSVIRNLFSIRFSGRLGAILDEYDRLRDLLAAPLYDFFGKFGITFPATLVDIFFMYLLLTAAVVRSHALTRKRDRIEYAQDPAVFRDKLRTAAEAVGFDPSEYIPRRRWGSMHFA